MPAPIPIELRERIVAARKGGGTLAELAQRFMVGTASVQRFLRRERTGQLEASPHGGGNPRRFDAAGERILRELVERTPDATKLELCAAFTEQTGLEASPSSLGRALERLGITRKKRVHPRLPGNAARILRKK